VNAFPLLRATGPLRERTFDVLVVGGGIYGAWTAYDAALRGLSVALIERHDWASGTSSASSKLIHGGLRYLEHYDFGLVRDALAERRRLHRLAPHLVRPLGFVMPVWKGPRASMLMLSAGLTLYDMLGGRGQPVGWHKRFSAKALLRHFPFVDPQRLLGGFWYGDCQEDDARLTLTVVAAAQQAGAIVANRIEAEALLEDGDAVAGARVHDRLADERFDLRARVVVNAAGPWAPQLVGASAPRVRRVKGIHIVVPAIPNCDQAFLLTANDGRVFFVLPWYGRTLIGTTEQEVIDPDRAHATDEEVRYLLAGVRNGLPGLTWTQEDVIARFAGVRTLQAEDAENLAAVTREFTVLEPRRGVVMPLGGKFTTARCDAVEIVDRVQRALGREPTPGRTARQPLPGAPPPDEPFERWQAAMIPLLKQRGVDAPAAAALTLRHGSRIGRIAELIHEDPRWARRLSPATTLVVAEVVMAIRDEMALSLSDVLRRRVPLLLLQRLDGLQIKELSLLVAPHLGRDSADIAGEFHAESAAVR
jgi:glycerol-3-phosphate dehydrogenase